MTRKRSITEARKELPRLVREAEKGRVTELTRHGESVAFLISRTEFERLSASTSFSEACDRFREDVDLASLDLDPDEIFGGARSPEPGREVDL